MPTYAEPLPDTRRRLVDAAARLVAEEGPVALTTRRLAREVGTSTMAVYTYFGGMPELVREVIREGFKRFADQLLAVERGSDPVAYLAELCRVARKVALVERHLYVVMFSGQSLAGFQLTDTDRRIGVYVLRIPRDAIEECMAAGRFRQTDPRLVTRHLWCQMHGLIQLELAGYFGGPFPAEQCLEDQLRDFMVGAGDTLKSATASLRTE